MAGKFVYFTYAVYFNIDNITLIKEAFEPKKFINGTHSWLSTPDKRSNYHTLLGLIVILPLCTFQQTL